MILSIIFVVIGILGIVAYLFAAIIIYARISVSKAHDSFFKRVDEILYKEKEDFDS